MKKNKYQVMLLFITVTPARAMQSLQPIPAGLNNYNPLHGHWMVAVHILYHLW